MKKILLFVALLLFFPFLVKAKIDISIDVNEEFSLGDVINFDYTISSDKQEDITYRYYYACSDPSAMVPPMQESTAEVGPGQSIKESFDDLSVDENFKTQQCEAIVEVINQDQEKEIIQSQRKEFSIKTPEFFTIDLNICKNQSCQEETKVFLINEPVYFDYNSDKENLDITTTLVYPDGESENLILPDQKKFQQEGTYLIKLTAKDETRQIEEQERFTVIKENVNIKETQGVCNNNQICEDKEDSANCPTDCVRKKSQSSNIVYFAAAFVTIIILIIGFILIWKIKKKS
ncbi:MAG: hypothetical protein GF335_04020 [Candidatus Moranbacteria bacterium]|nr:hypothetical protein [Candidatus Moranbacteria bacterium]